MLNNLVKFCSITLVINTFFASEMNASGYSYSKFVGPVHGPERIVKNSAYNGVSTVDFIARPEYQFAYGVEDIKTGVWQNHKEIRTGDEVSGLYSVVDPNGKLRVVKYRSNDGSGFQAEVINDGISTFHGKDPTNGQHHTETIIGHNPSSFHHKETPRYKSGEEDDYEEYIEDANDDVDDNYDGKSKSMDNDYDNSDENKKDEIYGNEYEEDE